MTTVCNCQQSLAAVCLICQQAPPTKKGIATEQLAVCGLALHYTRPKRTRYEGFCFAHICIKPTALAQAQKEAEEAAAQAAATEESRQKAVGMGKPIFARSLKPLTEPKDVEFHTAKRQRMQGGTQADKVHNQASALLSAEDSAYIDDKIVRKSAFYPKNDMAVLKASRQPLND